MTAFRVGHQPPKKAPDHGCTELVLLFVGGSQCTGDLVVVRVQHETDERDFAVGPALLVRGHEVKVKPGVT